MYKEGVIWKGFCQICVLPNVFLTAPPLRRAKAILPTSLIGKSDAHVMLTGTLGSRVLLCESFDEYVTIRPDYKLMICRGLYAGKSRRYEERHIEGCVCELKVRFE